MFSCGSDPGMAFVEGRIWIRSLSIRIRNPCVFFVKSSSPKDDVLARFHWCRPRGFSLALSLHTTRDFQKFRTHHHCCYCSEFPAILKSHVYGRWPGLVCMLHVIWISESVISWIYAYQRKGEFSL